jgi:molecular chaperone DnaK
MPRLVGIDFGSSKSMICAVEDGRPVIVPNAEGSPSTPSVVAFAGNGEVLVGEMARRQAVTNAERTVRLVKRRLGTAWKTEIDGKVFTAQQITAFVLQKLVRDASSYLREQVTDAVVAVPACFDEAGRQAIREAAQIAGLNVRRVIGASEATALTYYAARRADATILVLGLGGGTFEVSLLAVEEGVVEVKAASGDNHLGGDDWDQRIVDHLVQQARSAGGVDLSKDQTALQRLREAAEQAKIDLSSAAASQVSVPYIGRSADGPLHLQTTLTRAGFQAMTADLIDRCNDPFDQVMADAGMGAGDIDYVVLAGGATRMPAFAALARELAGGKEPTRSVNPDEAVAMGAAWLAGRLTGTAEGPLLLSVTPCSLGVKTRGGVFTKLIERNSTIPTKSSLIFTVKKGLRTGAGASGSHAEPSADGADDPGVTIGVYQGEHALAADNRLVGMLQVTGLPLTPGREREIEVAIEIDSEAVARVTARDLRTRSEQSVIITGSPAPAAGEADTLAGGAELEAREDPPGGRQHHKEAPATGASWPGPGPVIDLQLSPEAAQAARERGLGRLRQSFTVAGLRLLKSHSHGVQVFEFEQGLLRQQPGAPPETFRWDQIATVLGGSIANYRTSSITPYDRGRYRGTNFTYTITRRDGVSAKITGFYQDPARLSARSRQAISKNHRESIQRRYAALGEDTARHIATAQLPAAQAALARGEELTFGDITISAGGVRAGQRDPVPWTEISDVEVEHGTVRIKQAGKSLPLSRRPVSEIPNFLLFATLADTLRKRGPA